MFFHISINDPWTWTTGLRMTVGPGGGWGGGQQQGEIGTTVIEQQ